MISLFQFLNNIRFLTFGYWFNKYLLYKMDSVFILLQISWSLVFFFLPNYFYTYWFVQALFLTLFFFYLYIYLFRRFFFLRVYFLYRRTIDVSFYYNFFFFFFIILSIFSICLFFGLDVINFSFFIVLNALTIFFLLLLLFFFSFRFFLFLRFFVYFFIKTRSFLFFTYSLFFVFVYVSLYFLLFYYLTVSFSFFDSAIVYSGHYRLFDWFVLPVDHFYFSFFLNENLIVNRNNSNLSYFSNFFLHSMQSFSLNTQAQFCQSNLDYIVK